MYSTHRWYRTLTTNPVSLSSCKNVGAKRRFPLFLFTCVPVYLFTCLLALTCLLIMRNSLAWCHSKHYLHLKIAFAKRSIHDYDVFSTFIILFWPLRSSNHSLSLTCHIQCFDLPIIRFPVNTRRVWLTLHSPPSTLFFSQKMKKNVLHKQRVGPSFVLQTECASFHFQWRGWNRFLLTEISFWPLRFFEPVCYCGP